MSNVATLRLALGRCLLVTDLYHAGDLVAEYRHHQMNTDVAGQSRGNALSDDFGALQQLPVDF